MEDESVKMDDSAPKTPEISKSLSRELEEVISKQNLLTSRTRRRVLVSLQEQTNKEEDAEMEKLRQKAIDEIINSEKSYLRQLEIVDEFFMKPLQDSGHLDTQIYASIFGDILGIRQVNKELLSAMEISNDKIGQVFLDLAPYLKFYSTYANDFKQATNLVEEQLAKNKPFRLFMERQESRPEVCKKLNALLITPVQRIPRYKLLLDDIIKNTPRYHPDKDNLLEARTQIDAIAWYINDQIEDYERSKTMIDIQKSLTGGEPKIIKPDRKLIKQGNLMKVTKSGGHPQPRYVILFTDMLIYCKFKGSLNDQGILDLPKHDALEVRCVLPLKHTTVEEVMGKGVFTINCEDQNLMLYSPKGEDTDWVDQIKKAIRVLKKNRTTLKRESSMFQPMRKPDLVKMRRESLGTIMLKRKTDEAKMEMLKKKDSKTSLKSPLRLLSPLKRPAKDSLFSPCKLKRLSEEEKSPAPSSTDSKAPSSPTFVKPWSPAMRALTPIKERHSATKATPELRAKYDPDKSGGSPELTQRRNTRSLTLQRLGLRPNRAKKVGTIFRSPSIYDENNSRLYLTRTDQDFMITSSTSSMKTTSSMMTSSSSTMTASSSMMTTSSSSMMTSSSKMTNSSSSMRTSSDTMMPSTDPMMTSYLSGSICPLTPSTKPCNVEHLANERPVTRSRDASLPIRGQDSSLHVDKDVRTQLSQVPSCHEDKDVKMEDDTTDQTDQSEQNKSNGEKTSNEDQPETLDLEFKPTPIAIHEGILNEKPEDIDIEFKPAPIAPHDGILNKKSLFGSLTHKIWNTFRK